MIFINILYKQMYYMNIRNGKNCQLIKLNINSRTTYPYSWSKRNTTFYIFGKNVKQSNAQ